ncbi:MAG: hypothetical protein CMG67_01835 [Candidatus Marinimicrobia bacterium]|nr:hypothetical protein [Candidatus Neomarinimicrobiota bacterium]|tara:strand:- start:15872 stop:16468 length:597 start_codon:yes stop_codon:yes gene_type:complete
MKIKTLNSFIKIVFLFFSLFLILSCDNKTEKRSINGDVNIIVFSSLTCPHCANFHDKVIVKMKNDDSLKNFAKFEHRGFPLDLAALNAEKILHCQKNQENRFKLLTHLYSEQRNWTSRGNINDINESLIKISREFGLNKNATEKCLKSEKLEEKILEEVINAQKVFKIKSTPTIFINGEKYEGKHDYRSFKKEIEKLF